ncbi:MAG TPA: BlaI/MecI/CopY family transcriptional regulator [Candidatus Agathobaculum pullicola]|uniref:BlaI/MecI/CopY family transcriptional regulator n=1 Tax=Candidatus Agathobaculum pullicola TaxID=2838426 RepID=UPI001FA550A1|nr:BlaI/MecI/CopY family transcriptional regulator [Candidatus Agathobaculum pullicola]
MEKSKRLPDAELEVMQAVWSLEAPVTAAEVQRKVPSDWKTTSVLTFLSRLCDKGFLSCEKEGRQNQYTPCVTQEEYLQRESRSFVERVCGGSVKNLVASLSDAGALTAHDIDELRAFLDAQGR